jgi:pyruvate dehydrogenase E2 component (dihydrolipoamide acetyltransferase)
MPFTLTMPKLSPTMEEGTLVKWRKKEGDFVKAGDTLFEVATDKATVEHNALDAGFLRKILVKEGSVAYVNQAVAVFTEKQDESIESYQPEGEVRKPVAKVEAPAVATPSSSAPAPVARTSLSSQPAFVPEPPLTNYKFTPATPLARKLAEDKKIELSTVKGSGTHGKIVADDLSLGQPNTPVTFGRPADPKIIPGTYEEETLSPMRKVIATRLQDSKTYIPHFYVTQQVHVDALAALRHELSANGLKVSFNDFVVRATALALREHPAVNSGFNSVNNTIIRFKTIDIAIAVSVPAGLITPIVRHADYKNLGQLSQEIKHLATRAKEGSLAREEYAGGSFTISNLGMYGISEFSAIINPPQAAILAVGGIEDRPIVKGGHIVPGKTMHLTVSADHRVIDGAAVAQFLKTIQKYLEAPSLLLLS